MWDFFKDIDPFWVRVPGAFSSLTSGTWRPSVDIVDNDRSFSLLMDLPGIRKEDISVNLVGQQLCISGTRAVDLTKDDRDHLIFSERQFGGFERCFTFPQKVIEADTKAEFMDSVLRINVNKHEDYSKEKIPVKIN